MLKLKTALASSIKRTWELIKAMGTILSLIAFIFALPFIFTFAIVAASAYMIYIIMEIEKKRIREADP